MAGWLAVLCWWLAFAASHLVLSAVATRRWCIARLGDRGFQVMYSLVALATFIPLVRTYWQHKHEGPLLWNLTGVPGVQAVSIILSGLAFAVVVLAFFQPSATGMLPSAAPRARGMTRITRHPLFVGIGLWGLAHCLVNGFLSDVVFFGGFVAFSLIGSAHQDSRKRLQPALRAFYAETSLLPFVAVLTRRNHLMLSEIPWLGAAIGVIVAAVLYLLHPRLFAG